MGALTIQFLFWFCCSDVTNYRWLWFVQAPWKFLAPYGNIVRKMVWLAWSRCFYWKLSRYKITSHQKRGCFLSPDSGKRSEPEKALLALYLVFFSFSLSTCNRQIEIRTVLAAPENPNCTSCCLISFCSIFDGDSLTVGRWQSFCTPSAPKMNLDSF